MKKLLFSHNGVEYFLNGHSNHRMKVRKISSDYIQTIFENPIKEEVKGYGTLVEGISDGRRVRVFYRDKPRGYREILTAIRYGKEEKVER
jgi:hypothetical protein